MIIIAMVLFIVLRPFLKHDEDIVNWTEQTQSITF